MFSFLANFPWTTSCGKRGFVTASYNLFCVLLVLFRNASTLRSANEVKVLRTGILYVRCYLSGGICSYARRRFCMQSLVSLDLWSRRCRVGNFSYIRIAPSAFRFARVYVPCAANAQCTLALEGGSKSETYVPPVCMRNGRHQSPSGQKCHSRMMACASGSDIRRERVHSS